MASVGTEANWRLSQRHILSDGEANAGGHLKQRRWGESQTHPTPQGSWTRVGPSRKELDSRLSAPGLQQHWKNTALETRASVFMPHSNSGRI